MSFSPSKIQQPSKNEGTAQPVESSQTVSQKKIFYTVARDRPPFNEGYPESKFKINKPSRSHSVDKGFMQKNSTGREAKEKTEPRGLFNPVPATRSKAQTGKSSSQKNPSYDYGDTKPSPLKLGGATQVQAPLSHHSSQFAVPPSSIQVKVTRTNWEEQYREWIKKEKPEVKSV